MTAHIGELRAGLANLTPGDLTQALAGVDRQKLIEAVYPVDGPHDTDRVEDAAEAAAHLVRYLNHATRSGRAALPPPAVDRVVAHIAAAVAGMSQTTRQLGERLWAYVGDPNLAADGMAHQSSTPDHIASQAVQALRDTSHALDQLHEALERVHNLTARLYLPTPDEPEET